MLVSLSACLLLASISLCSPANTRPQRQVFMRHRGMISPTEVVDYLSYLPNTINEMDFTRCDEKTISQIMAHLPKNAQTILQTKLVKEQRGRDRLRSSSDGVMDIGSSFAAPPRMATGGRGTFEGSARRPRSTISNFSDSNGALWDWQKSFYQGGILHDASLLSDDDENDSHSSSSTTTDDADSYLSSRDKRQSKGLLTILSSQSSESSSEEVEGPSKKPSLLYISPTNMYFSDESAEDEEDRYALESYRKYQQKQDHSNMYIPPAEPRRRNKKSIDLKRSDELWDAGYLEVGMDRYVSPTRAKAKRKPLSRESSGGSSHLSRETLMRSHSSPVNSSKFRGIANHDNICYITSVIQALFHIPSVNSALSFFDVDLVASENRAAFQTLSNIFDGLGKYIDRPLRSSGRFSSSLEAVELSKRQISSLVGAHVGQGDASEVLQHIIQIASAAIEHLFTTKLNEIIVEDKPDGFIFTNRWEPTRYITLNILDHDYKNLQEYVARGVVSAVQLAMDKDDQKHFEYLGSNINSANIVPAVKYADIAKPSEVICFHLIRYTHSEGGDHNPSISMAELRYPEDLFIGSSVYALQSIVVHEDYGISGNRGHYYTIARTMDEDEDWIELNDAKATVVTRTYALSKASTATLLFYNLKIENESDLEVTEDLSDVDFINLEENELYNIRDKIFDAVPFSRDFKMAPYQRPFYVLYQNKSCPKEVVRQALAHQQCNPEVDLDDMMEEIWARNQKSSFRRLLKKFPDRVNDIIKAIENHHGSYSDALAELKRH